MPSPTIQKGVSSFYTLKCLCCFFVVAIHTEFCINDQLRFISGIGMALFLAITGYFLFSNDKEREIQKCLNWAKKAFLIFLMCNVVYIVSHIIVHNKFPGNDLKFWWKNLIMGNRVCFALWYLAALWEALLIIALLRKYLPKLIYLLPLLFIVVYLMINSESPLIPYNFKFCSILSILQSLPFLATGYLIHKHEASFLNLKIEAITITLLIAAFVENNLYIVLLNHKGIYHLTSYPLIVSAMLLCIKYPDFKIPYLTTIGKKHSPNIYYFHPLLMTVWGECGFSPFNQWQTPLIWLACIPVSILICFIRDKALSLFPFRTA